jgi:hypothetical protein
MCTTEYLEGNAAMTEHKHAEVLRAIADGKEVEYWYLGEWLPMTADRSPLTHLDYDWRIKPEPKPPIVIEVTAATDGACMFYVVDQSKNTRFTFDPDTKLPIKVELI